MTTPRRLRRPQAKRFGTRCQCGQYQIGCQPIESLEYHYASNCGVAW